MGPVGAPVLGAAVAAVGSAVGVPCVCVCVAARACARMATACTLQSQSALSEAAWCAN